MTRYSKTTKKQLDVWNGTFSTVMTNYKTALTQCRQSEKNCDGMKIQLGKAEDTLREVKNLATSVKSVVAKNKTDISNYQKSLGTQTQKFQNTMGNLNHISDSDNASNTLRKNKKTTLTYDYFTLAYYILTNALILYLLHKQYKFSALYFLAVFLVILIVIGFLAWWGVPYN